MKRRKKILRDELSQTIFGDSDLNVNRIGDIIYFEIGEEITSDVAEAVSILIRKVEFNDPIWKTDIKNIEYNNITPSKSLFWLTGGYIEWDSLKNYNTNWSNCSNIFEEKFGNIIIECVKKSINLKEVRDYFLDNLNIGILYDFAISKDLIK